ncbi:hypothetical protein A3Q56_03556 [Intoshia linei]|uniref:Uncharacterized protein n=1 Tax=Intoshia linei TaxID=1819745 RepID=A0A177B5J1_9BILA|nr:hypothetical protein A3Q56_03556 [Intoshia linei]
MYGWNLNIQRSLEKIEIIDPNYLIKNSNDKLVRKYSFMDSFKVNISEKSFIPYFIRSLFIQMFIVLAFVIVRLCLLVVLINALPTVSINFKIANYLLLIRGIIETALAYQLLTFSIHTLYTKFKQLKKVK